ncbi:MAG: beta-propeller fold lactonase family protein, partial [Caldilineaceae bacterium]|nr:beta-propeller fold lactonase family protein [Caldilineaceae bacterium]
KPAPDAQSKDTRLFRVAGGGNLTLIGLTLKDGYTSGYGGAIYSDAGDSTINLSGVTLIDNQAEGNGGAIYTSGRLNVLLSSFSGNQALGVLPDSVINNPGTGFGGAIESGGSDTIQLSATNFSGNIASKGGGAISNVGASLVLSDTVFTGNIADAIGDNDGGGALMNRGPGGFRIARSFFTANLTPKGSGGAIYNNLNAAPSTIIDSAFTANISGDLAQGGVGGALYNEEDLVIKRVTFNGNIATGDGRGGAILNNRAALLQLTNSSFFANVAPDGKGGAIANIDSPFPVSSDSTVELRNVTISSNRATTGGALYNEELLTLVNTIVEEGTTGGGGTCAGTKAVKDNGHNIQNPGTACGNAMQSVDPKLDLPQPSGGPLVWLLTQSPKAGSPAIDQGDDAVCNAAPVNKEDETGSSRPKNGDSTPGSSCDIGAIEAGTALPGFGSEPAQPGPIDFGNVQIGTSNDAGFEISETGILPLAIATATLGGDHPGDFQVLTATPLAIPNGSPAVPFKLRCIPTASGERTATLTLVTDDPKHLKVDYDLTCNGTVAKVPGFAADPIAPGPIDLGTTYVGDLASRSFQLLESGNADPHVSLQAINGDNADDFILLAGLPATVVEGGAAASVAIRCIPKAIGLRTAQLVLTTDDPTQPTVTFDLVCRGEALPTPYLAAPGTKSGDLDGAYGVVVSPDAKNLYVTSYYAGSLTTFDRELTTGAVTPVGTETDGLAGARKVAISPDGKQLYVTAGDAGTFTIYQRHADSGQLAFQDQYSNDAVVSGLGGAHGVAVSPDGRNIYVTGANKSALVIFSRDGDGFVGYQDTIVSVPDLAGARSVVVSPDGQHVYASGYTNTTNGTVSVYSRDLTDGSLTHVQTRREGELIGLNRFLDGLAGAHALVLSADGAYLYVAGLHDNSLALFRRDPLSGKLTYMRTYKDGVSGMDALGGTTSVALDPSGEHLYTTAL